MTFSSPFGFFSKFGVGGHIVGVLGLGGLNEVYKRGWHMGLVGDRHVYTSN